MQNQSGLIRIKRKTILYFVLVIIILGIATPALADYLGPNRVVTGTTNACKVILYACRYVAAKDDWRYRKADNWSCSDESKPWQAYPSDPSSQGCFAATEGDAYWEREETQQEATTTYPPATISSSLQNCTLQNGWCVTAPQLSLSGAEPVSGYNIIAIEGSLNGQTFACANSTCSVPLNEGNNNFAYWALSSWGDSSMMGTLNTKVDSQLPTITGIFSGTSGSNGWYLSPVSFNGTASDTTSGLASFTCTLDGAALGSCTSITVNSEGTHTLVLTARDNAGNNRTLTQSTSLDTQNPILNASLSGTLGSNNWYTTAILNASASDPTPGSGLSIFQYNLDNNSWITFPVSGAITLPEGKHSIDVLAKDNAGRSVSSSKSFWLDSVPPSINFDPTGTLGANDWYTTNLNLITSTNDATSGIDIFEYSLDNGAWTTYTTPLTIGDGSHNISFWAQDAAGLVTQADRTYKVDTHIPQIAGSLGGILGTNSWYISDVTLSASASDPVPGSGLDTFAYILNGGTETSYTNALVLSDGEHTVQLNAKDKAGLTYSLEQRVKVDTIHPSLNVQTTLPNWIKDTVTMNGTSGDNGSGLSKVEISTDGGQTWKSVIGTASWSHIWNTPDSSNGTYKVQVRTTDNAGLTTEQAFTTGVDNNGPKISVPDSWYQWDTVILDVWDNHSGLSEVRVEISDPEERWPTRKINLDPERFPLDFKWDRRFGDDTVAPLGTYNMKVIAFDNLGNLTRKNASINILLGILPAGPIATSQPYVRTDSTPVPTYASTSIASPMMTQAPMVSAFGSTPEPVAQVTTLPETIPTPRITPTQTSVLDWLQSIFVSNANEETVTEIGISEETKTVPQSAASGSNVLWGTTAAAMIGAVTAYALEERRKQQEEQARQAALEAKKEERHKKIRARKMEKLEVKWAQERAWEEARLEAEGRKQYHDSERSWSLPVTQPKISSIETEEEAWLEKKIQIDKQPKPNENLQAGLAAYYAAMRQGEEEVQTENIKQKSWWQKSIDWIDDHQAEIALGVGVAVGIGAIILSGGTATPLVAAAWMAGAAAVAGGTVVLGTIGLNTYYGRDWKENVGRNLAISAITATAVTGAGFLLAGNALFNLGNGVAGYCATHPAICSRTDVVLKTWDKVEEVGLIFKGAVQTARGDSFGAAETQLELQLEYLDGGVPGNAVAMEMGDAITKLGPDALEIVKKYGNNIVPLLLKYGDDALDIIGAYGDEGIAILQKYGDEAIDLIKGHGTPAIKVMEAINPDKAKILLETLDDDVLDYAIQQGPDAVTALSRWSPDDLSKHGPELALRSKKDAKVLADVKKLIALGPIDPKHLTGQQRALINAIAANSTQYADKGQVVLGKWVDISNGFVETAQDTGSVHYNPHPDMWNLLGGLGNENQNEVAWLINQQVVQTGINKGLPFEYTLNGVPAKTIENEHNAIEAIFSGKTDVEILDTLDVKVMPIRLKELRELQQAGYKFVFDEINNSYIFTLP